MMPQKEFRIQTTASPAYGVCFVQDNVAAIKQAEEADRAAAKAAVAAARAAAKQEQYAAALAAWRAKTNWVPRGPKKPRAKALQADHQRHTAANGSSSSIDPELLGFLEGPAAAKRAAAAAEAAEAAAAAKATAEAEAAAAAAPKPGGITIKNRGISIMRVGAKQPAEKQQQQIEEPGSPSAASVEGERHTVRLQACTVRKCGGCSAVIVACSSVARAVGSGS
jgi:hypothetical protein